MPGMTNGGVAGVARRLGVRGAAVAGLRLTPSAASLEAAVSGLADGSGELGSNFGALLDTRPDDGFGVVALLGVGFLCVDMQTFETSATQRHKWLHMPQLD